MDNSIDDFLGKNNSPEIERIMQEWKIYYEKLITYGANIHIDILKKGNLGKDDSLPLIMLLRNSIEILSSISILVTHSCSEPARILLRTLLESYFYIEYLVEKDTKRRSLGFLLIYFHDKLAGLYKLDKNTQQGQQFYKSLQNDKYLHDFSISDMKSIQSAIMNLESLINLELYKEVEAEYKAIKKKKKKVYWCELFGGPQNTEQLSHYLHQVGLYQLIFRSLSKNTHGIDIIDRKIYPGEKSGETLFSQILFPFSAQFVTQFTFTIMINIYTTIIKYHLPEKQKEFNIFYTDEIKDFFNHISRNDVLKIK